MTVFSLCPQCLVSPFVSFFFFNEPPPTEIYTLSLHDALPICSRHIALIFASSNPPSARLAFATLSLSDGTRSEEHTSELQSLRHLVCRLLLEKKKKKKMTHNTQTTTTHTHIQELLRSLSTTHR